MKRITPESTLILIILTAIISLAGCSNTLVKDNTRLPTKNTSHCSGSEWTDDSSLAVLPIPVLAFLLPHEDLHDIQADNYLKRCGDSTKLVNREVEVGRGACIPAALTFLLTLGIWQWCPAHVGWEADVNQ